MELIAASRIGAARDAAQSSVLTMRRYLAQWRQWPPTQA